MLFFDERYHLSRVGGVFLLLGASGAGVATGIYGGLYGFGILALSAGALAGGTGFLFGVAASAIVAFFVMTAWTGLEAVYHYARSRNNLIHTQTPTVENAANEEKAEPDEGLADGTSHAIQSLEQEIQTLKNDLADASAKSKTLAQSSDERLQEKTQELVSLQKRLNEAQQSFEASKTADTQTIQRLEHALTTEQKTKEAYIESSTKEITELTLLKTQADNKAQAVAAKNNQLMAEIFKVNQEKTTIQSQFQEFQSKIKILEKTVSAKEEEIITNKAAFSQQLNELKEKFQPST